MRSRPSPVPHGRTARRLGWAHLPPHVREQIQQRCGSTVVDATSQDSGFTPGFASVLTCEDGSRHFVKAASVSAQRMFAAAYRQEGHTLAALPADVPAAGLRWLIDDDWVVLGLEYVHGRHPHRPWTHADLDASLDALELCAETLTPAPPDLYLDTFAAELGPFASLWDRVRATRNLAHADEAADLAAGCVEVTVGDTVVHTDLRDDNVLLTADGAMFCDWNWPVIGAAWVDTVMIMIGPRGDGLDVDAALAQRPLTRDVPAEHIDRLIALLTGYFLKSADDPVPSNSPHLRDHQRWQGEVCWDWLSERRGWS